MHEIMSRNFKQFATNNISLIEVERGSQLLFSTWSRAIGARRARVRDFTITRQLEIYALPSTLDAPVPRNHRPNEPLERHKVLKLLFALFRRLDT